ncbi:MAG TPA: hypothetical protein VFB49_09375 [Patescibacteria group bacterium]|nr:hypothetical protein [Patescibacteria group bacterium]
MAHEDSPPATEARASGAASISSQLRELTTDALRYWEIRRLFYNALLAVIVLAHFAAAWPASGSSLTFDGVLGLFLLAVLANVAYSVVYVADVFIQFSGFRASRARWRWVLLIVGFAFAGVLTHFFSAGALGGTNQP